MIVYTDTIPYAVQKLGFKKDYEEIKVDNLDKSISRLAKRLFQKETIYSQKNDELPFWQYLFIVGKSEDSQFDILTRLSSEDVTLPDRILCLASEGKNFHGFKNRPWASLQGNLHLSAYFCPDTTLDHFASAFMVLPAVSVVETIDEIPELKAKAMIKWVNDILIDKAKVSGVISSTKIQGNILKNVVLGVGLNIEAKPFVVPNEFVPKVTCIRLHTKSPDAAYYCKIFRNFISKLEINYKKILQGNYFELLDKYRDRSLIINNEVIIEQEQTQKRIKGTVESIGNDLELYIKDLPEPINDGRLILL